MSASATRARSMNSPVSQAKVTVSAVRVIEIGGLPPAASAASRRAHVASGWSRRIVRRWVAGSIRAAYPNVRSMSRAFEAAKVALETRPGAVPGACDARRRAGGREQPAGATRIRRGAQRDRERPRRRAAQPREPDVVARGDRQPRAPVASSGWPVVREQLVHVDQLPAALGQLRGERPLLPADPPA